MAEDQARSQPEKWFRSTAPFRSRSAPPESVALPPDRPAHLARSLITASAAALPPKQAKPEPAPLTSGVIDTQPIAAIPGSSEPMKPVRVKTVLVKAGSTKLASAGPVQSVSPIANTSVREDAPETSGSVVARATMPPQPANFGTGHGILGVLPASGGPRQNSQAMASADPTPKAQPQAVQQNGAIKPVVSHSGWIIQVGALETESEAHERLEAARGRAHGMLGKADPFTESVARGNKKLYRAASPASTAIRLKPCAAP